jgi:HlyD family secretion protein
MKTALVCIANLWFEVFRSHRYQSSRQNGTDGGTPISLPTCGSRVGGHPWGIGCHFRWLVLVLSAGFFAGCDRSPSNRIQGYVEGEFVYVASPLAGTLEKLDVQRGAIVKPGDPLYTLESVPEKASRDEAERRLTQAKASWEDATKGKRPSEIESISAQLKQARAALDLAIKDAVRLENLSKTPGAVAAEDIDRVHSVRDQDQQRVSQLEAELTTAQLGARADQIAAAEANVRAQEAVLARADWDLAQKRQDAPKQGLVFDTLYREGEWVPAGRPVVVLLPPENIKVRAFVPEGQIGSVHPGDQIQVLVDGVNDRSAGKISYISPRAEYTPPVIYSRESRSKLVFMIEAVFDPATAARLHPGQPVDVLLGK